jgi:hypothetical protein
MSKKILVAVMLIIAVSSASYHLTKDNTIITSSNEYISSPAEEPTPINITHSDNNDAKNEAPNYC